jgi:hypothetical protein
MARRKRKAAIDVSEPKSLKERFVREAREQVVKVGLVGVLLLVFVFMWGKLLVGKKDGASVSSRRSRPAAESQRSNRVERQAASRANRRTPARSQSQPAATSIAQADPGFNAVRAAQQLATLASRVIRGPVHVPAVFASPFESKSIAEQLLTLQRERAEREREAREAEEQRQREAAEEVARRKAAAELAAREAEAMAKANQGRLTLTVPEMDLAIIDGQRVKVGDPVGPMTLAEIGQGYCVLKGATTSLRLQVWHKTIEAPEEGEDGADAQGDPDAEDPGTEDPGADDPSTDDPDTGDTQNGSKKEERS